METLLLGHRPQNLGRYQVFFPSASTQNCGNFSHRKALTGNHLYDQGGVRVARPLMAGWECWVGCGWYAQPKHLPTPHLPMLPDLSHTEFYPFHKQASPRYFKLLECPIPAPLSSSSVCLSQKIRITSVLAVFLKLGQMDFSKASNSISHHLTSIFPENCQICWVGRVGGLGYLRGSRGLNARRARRTKSGPEGPPARSRGPEGP